MTLWSSFYRCDVEPPSPCLQVAMETQQDAVGVAVKVQQRSDQSCQTTELIDLQEETSRQRQSGSVGQQQRRNNP